MIRIWLLRHGKTQGPAALNGITDVAVEPSVQQAIASQLSTLPFTRVISSPYVAAPIWRDCSKRLVRTLCSISTRSSKSLTLVSWMDKVLPT